MNIRLATEADFSQWLPLWEAYNIFYKRTISEEVTKNTWQRFLNPAEKMFALVAEKDSRLVGLTHYLFHRHTALIADACYLQDLYTVESLRGQGIGRALIEAVSVEAKKAGSPSIYWMTHETNEAGMKLYDKVAKKTGFLVYKK